MSPPAGPRTATQACPALSSCRPRELGPRFLAVEGRPEGWTPAAELFGAQFPRHAGQLASSVGTTSLAVAGTLLLQQYAGLVVSPVVAGFYEEHRLLDCAMNSVSVQCHEGRPQVVAFASSATPVSEPMSDHSKLLIRRLFDEHLAVCARMTRDRTRVGQRVLHGAIAHAIATAFLHLSWRRADKAHYTPIAQKFLADIPELSSLVTIGTVHVAEEPWMYYHRNSCCLAFRTTSNQSRSLPYCSNCPAVDRPTIQQLFARATQMYAAAHP